MAPDERGWSLVGQHLGVYQVLAPIGAGGPASARETTLGELRRGLAVAQLGPRP